MTDNLEEISGDVLRFFCVENKEQIVGCNWYDTKYCLKQCKFYRRQKYKDTKVEVSGE